MSDETIVNHSPKPGQNHGKHKGWKIPLGCLLLIILGTFLPAGVISLLPLP
jgi:hypothetical protein